MEHAPLRPVPSRPAGPIDPAAATREVVATLPDLSVIEARALALVALAQYTRPDAASLLGTDEETLSDALANARKHLRRTVAPLPGSGWCERAERLISDRLDATVAGAAPLADRDAGRLDVHLRNCPRCVEHERRLVQATDWLVSGLAPAPRPQPPPLAEVEDEAPTAETPPAEAPPAEAPPEDTPPAEVPPAEAPPAEEPRAETPLVEEPPVEEPPVEEPPVEGPPVDEPPAAGLPAAVPAPGVAAPRPADVAAAAEVLVASRTRRQIAAAMTWNALILLAVLLAIATIGFTIAGILGAEL